MKDDASHVLCQVSAVFDHIILKTLILDTVHQTLFVVFVFFCDTPFFAVPFVSSYF